MDCTLKRHAQSTHLLLGLLDALTGEDATFTFALEAGGVMLEMRVQGLNRDYGGQNEVFARSARSLNWFASQENLPLNERFCSSSVDNLRLKC